MRRESEYRALWSYRARHAIRERVTELRGTQHAIRLLQIIRFLHTRLQRNPHGLGEIYRSRGSVAEHHAAYGFVGINFAIDTQRQVVLVRECRFLSTEVDK